MLTFEMRQQVGPYVSPLESETRVYKEWSDGVAWTSHFVKCDVGGGGMTTTGGCYRITEGWQVDDNKGRRFRTGFASRWMRAGGAKREKGVEGGD